MGQSLTSCCRRTSGENETDYNYEQLRLKPVSLAELEQMAGRQDMVRAGSTNDYVRRRGEYVYKQHYHGTMYYAPTGDMNTSENELLKFGYRHNVQCSSNQEAKPGYVYLIQEH